MRTPAAYGKVTRVYSTSTELEINDYSKYKEYLVPNNIRERSFSSTRCQYLFDFGGYFAIPDVLL